MAALLGALSTIAGEIVTRALVFFGIGKYSIYNLDSLLVTFNRPTPILGLIVNFIVGGSVGVILYYKIKQIGLDYLVIKSACVGILAWAPLEFAFTVTVEGKYIELRPISDYYVQILGAIIFGITMGILFNKYLFKRTIS
ncbi:hypothetical protein [Desulfosporosinus sp. Sb-LF]|uniref:hypothetical protein n=1 Tax=Desulfosporosinus sp. Sb-LF TaxID=2560027 RepID=UPI00107F610C|nr:hypothetical protein [Desulfosporosinus sp. Sb-LF]TGE34488.1 hypothetical protein E4K68_02020 [Desulfosporosinus sp. Sb-LF]